MYPLVMSRKTRKISTGHFELNTSNVIDKVPLPEAFHQNIRTTSCPYDN